MEKNFRSANSNSFFLLILSDNMIHNMGSQLGGSYEILYYKRTGHGMWLQVIDTKQSIKK